ncbi:MAG: 50S ribosomal protein L17 [Rhodothermus sp.]|nr:50S ribosomal protein L17 [Rhodothermus sp.]
MRHRKKGFKLGRTYGHRRATLAALSCALIRHKRIRTTLAKAKALRVFIEPLITRAKEDTTHNRRQVFRYLQNKEAVKELFGEIAEKVNGRPGGYTRVVRIGRRPGDGAEMAVIELVDYNDIKPTSTRKTRKRTRRGRGRSRRQEGAEAAVPTTAAQPAEAEQATPEASESAASGEAEPPSAAVPAASEAEAPPEKAEAAPETAQQEQPAEKNQEKKDEA